MDYKENQAEGKRKNSFYIIVSVMVGYSVFLELFCTEWIKKGIYPFGLEENKVGIFLSNQFWISIIVQGVLATVVFYTVIKKRILYQGVLDGCVLGISINLIFLSLLRRLDTIDHFIMIRNQTLAAVLIEWILTVGVLKILFYKKSR